MIEVEQLSETMKGVANHYRIRALVLISENSGITLDSICERLNANYKTMAVHTGRLHKSGLISKQYRGSFVEHRLTKRGVNVLKFLRKLE